MLLQFQKSVKLCEREIYQSIDDLIRTRKQLAKSQYPSLISCTENPENFATEIDSAESIDDEEFEYVEDELFEERIRKRRRGGRRRGGRGRRGRGYGQR